MKMQLIALALLISPAQAAKFNASDCAQIEYIFDACSVSEQRETCYMVHRAGAGESKYLATFFDAHPDLNFDKMQALCQQVCYRKMNWMEATKKICPNYRPKP